MALQSRAGEVDDISNPYAAPAWLWRAMLRSLYPQHRRFAVDVPAATSPEHQEHNVLTRWYKVKGLRAQHTRHAPPEL
jgi:hypothetical protein